MNVMRLRMSHGCGGYGVYYMLMERLRQEPGYIGECDYNTLSYMFGADAELVRAVVEDFGLFVLTDDGMHFYSPELMESMKVKDAKKTKARESARARWNKKPASTESDSQPVNGSVSAVQTEAVQTEAVPPEAVRTEAVKSEAAQPEPAKPKRVNSEPTHAVSAQPEPAHRTEKFMSLSEAECMQRFDKLSEQVFDTDSAMWLDSVSNTYHIDDMHKAIAKFRKYVISMSLAEKIRSLTDFKKYFVWRAESFLRDRSDDTNSYNGYGRGSLASRMPEEPGCGLIP